MFSFLANLTLSKQENQQNVELLREENLLMNFSTFTYMWNKAIGLQDGTL